MNQGTMTRVCGDCGKNPSPDQRAHVQNGRCRHCTRDLIKAARRRRIERDERRANETYVSMYDLPEAPAYDGWEV